MLAGKAVWHAAALKGRCDERKSFGLEVAQHSYCEPFWAGDTYLLTYLLTYSMDQSPS